MVAPWYVLLSVASAILLVLAADCFLHDAAWRWLRSVVLIAFKNRLLVLIIAAVLFLPDEQMRDVICWESVNAVINFLLKDATMKIRRQEKPRSERA